MPTDFFIGLCVLVVAFGVAHLAVTGWLANPFGAWISDPNDPNNVTIEAAIREEIWKPTGKLTKADLGQVSELNPESNQLTGLPKDLEKLTRLTNLVLGKNPDLTRAQILKLQNALPECDIFHD